MEETQCYPMLIGCGCMVFIGFDHTVIQPYGIGDNDDNDDQVHIPVHC